MKATKEEEFRPKELLYKEMATRSFDWLVLRPTLMNYCNQKQEQMKNQLWSKRQEGIPTGHFDCLSTIFAIRHCIMFDKRLYWYPAKGLSPF